MDMPQWPRPPIRPEDLPLIRELLSPEDYKKLLKMDRGCVELKIHWVRSFVGTQGSPLPAASSRHHQNSL